VVATAQTRGKNQTLDEVIARILASAPVERTT
jgi:hypothetical protein